MYFKFANSPPTFAARWMTCVGLNLSNIASVCALSRRSPSFDERKTHVSPGRAWVSV